MTKFTRDEFVSPTIGKEDLRTQKKASDGSLSRLSVRIPLSNPAVAARKRDAKCAAPKHAAVLKLKTIRSDAMGWIPEPLINERIRKEGCKETKTKGRPADESTAATDRIILLANQRKKSGTDEAPNSNERQDVD